MRRNPSLFRVSLLLWALSLAASPGSVWAEVRLARVFGDHMVLQADVPIPVWGQAAPGERVAVRLAGGLYEATADASGSWSCETPALAASHQPIEFGVSGSNRIALANVVVGEVWLCAGQSNMEWPVKNSSGAKEELSKGADPRLRLLNLPGVARGGSGKYGPKHFSRLTPDKFCQGAWAVCDPESAKDFSAVGYHFGKALKQSLDVPIGLINPAIGGTPAEAWIRRQALADTPELAAMVEGNWLENPVLDEWCRRRAQSNFAAAVSQGTTLPGDALGPNHSFKPSFMWEAGVAPLLPFPVRGVIWYQGESNAESPRRVAQHQRIFETLVTDWRKQWRREEMPFLFVQLPAMGRANWPAFRQTQLESLRRLQNTGMAVTIDTGHPTNVHPTDKRPIGQRLARLALGMVYKELSRDAWSGPVVSKVQAKEDRVVLSFDHVGVGLEASDGKSLRHFEVAGRGGEFHAAEAEIRGEQIIVWCDQVNQLQRVRYAWVPFPVPPVNLFNQAGLPASPFEAPVGFGE